MKKGIFDNLDFLNDPQETQEQRKSFCHKVVTARPVIEELIKRLMREIAREYFGKAPNLETLNFFNGMIAFGEAMKNSVLMFEGEQMERQEQAKAKDNKPVSGSELGV